MRLRAYVLAAQMKIAAIFRLRRFSYLEARAGVEPTCKKASTAQLAA